MPGWRLLTSADHRRRPWRNGGGVSIDVATSEDEHGLRWSFGRTTIGEPGRFSDFSGYDRIQLLIGGRGLVLTGATTEIDLREPWKPMRYDGALALESRLEGGAVEVVNLIGRRDAVTIDLTLPSEGESILALGPNGTTIAYAPAPAALRCGGETIELAPDSALIIEDDGPILLERGRIVVALIGELA